MSDRLRQHVSRSGDGFDNGKLSRQAAETHSEKRKASVKSDNGVSESFVPLDESSVRRKKPRFDNDDDDNNDVGDTESGSNVSEDLLQGHAYQATSRGSTIIHLQQQQAASPDTSGLVPVSLQQEQANIQIEDTQTTQGAEAQSDDDDDDDIPTIGHHRHVTPISIETDPSESYLPSSSPDFEILGDLPLPTAGDSHPASKQNKIDEAWHSVANSQNHVRAEIDFNLYPYKGWKIESPEIQLIRAKNFLADEDADRTVDWQRKFAELTEYFEYLLRNYKGEEWGHDLHDAIRMLHTHWITENYHYGRPKLNLDFPTTAVPKESRRLPQIPGPRVTVERSEKQRGERNIIARKIESVHDKQYKMLSPKDLEVFVKEHASHSAEFWNMRPTLAIRRGAPFNMMTHEIMHYEQKMEEGFNRANSKSTSGFTFSADKDMIVHPDGTQKPSLEAQRSYAALRGTRRAALQKCLNLFDNSENLDTYSPWSVVTLPKPKEPKKLHDVGLVIETMTMADIPKKASRDPFAYTVTHERYRKNEQHWAQWTRSHAIKEAYGHRLWLGREEAIVNLPKNFKGPYIHSSIDKETEKTLKYLRQGNIITQRLERADRCAPRELITDVIRIQEQARQGKDWQSLGLQLDDDDDFSDVTQQELDYLMALTEPSVNRKQLLSRAHLDPVEELFLRKVTSLTRDISPEALFWDGSFKSEEDFRTALNQGGNGPVKQYQFGTSEITRYAKTAAEFGILELGTDNQGRPIFSRAVPDVHPEHLLRWDHTQSHQQSSSPSSMPYDNNEEDDDDGGRGSETSTISTKVSVSDSGEEKPRRDIPSISRLTHKERQDMVAQDTIQKHAPRTDDFFHRLAYRWGRTLKEADERREDMPMPDQIESNKDFLRTIVGYWEDDANRRPNNPKKNPDTKGGVRVTPAYRDIVQEADPDNHKESWGGSGLISGDDDPREARELVRTGLLREAWENKTLAHPSRVVTYSNGEVCELRDSRWSFARGRRQVKQWWDINRWPVHLQSEETQQKIRATGPRPRS